MRSIYLALSVIGTLLSWSAAAPDQTTFGPCLAYQQIFGPDLLGSFTDTSYASSFQQMSHTTPLIVFAPPPSRIMAYNSPLYTSIEALNQQSYVVRYTTRANCQDSSCEYARFSGRRLTVDGSASVLATLPSPAPLTGTATALQPGITGYYVGPQENALHGFAALAFDQGENRYSLQIRGANKKELVELQRWVIANVQFKPRFTLVMPQPVPTVRPTPSPTDVTPTPTPAPAPLPVATPQFLGYSPHAGPAGTIIRILGSNISDVHCVTIGPKLARFNAQSSRELDVIVPTSPESGTLQVFLQNEQANLDYFSAFPDVTEPTPAHAIRGSLPSVRKSANVSLVSRARLPALLASVARVLQKKTAVPVLLPTYLPSGHPLSMSVAAASKNAYSVAFMLRDCKPQLLASCELGGVTIERMWPFAGAGYWKLNPILGTNRELFNGISAAYAPYTCEATCGMTSLSFGYRQDLTYQTNIVTLRWRTASWAEIRDVANSLIEIARPPKGNQFKRLNR